MILQMEKNMLKRILILSCILLCLTLPQKSNAENHQLDNWYLGLGLGTAIDARYERDNQYSITFDKAMDANGFDKTPKVTANLKAGIRIYPNTFFGFDYTAVRQEGEAIGLSGKIEGSLQISNYFLMFTHYPTGERFFIRAGGGRSDFIATFSVSGSTGTSRIHGYGLLGGVGYAIPLGERLKVSLNLDYSRQFYSGHEGEPDGSSFTAVYLGIGIN